MATRKKPAKTKPRPPKARKLNCTKTRFPLPKAVPAKEYPTLINALNRLHILCAAWSRNTLATTQNVVTALLPQLKQIAAILTSMEKRLDTMEVAVGAKPPPKVPQNYLRVLETPFQPHPPHAASSQAKNNTPSLDNPVLNQGVYGVDDLCWSRREKRVILQLCAVTLRDLVEKTESDLLKLKGCGRKTVRSIQENLRGVGLSLGMTPSPLPPAPAAKPPEAMTAAEVEAACRRGEQNCHVCFDFECGDNTNPYNPVKRWPKASPTATEPPAGSLFVRKEDEEAPHPPDPCPHEGEPCIAVTMNAPFNPKSTAQGATVTAPFNPESTVQVTTVPAPFKTCGDGETCEHPPLPQKIQDAVNDVAECFGKACGEVSKMFSDANVKPAEESPAVMTAKCEECGNPATRYWACRPICDDCRHTLASPPPKPTAC
jgi:hypothetical protein